MKELLKKLVGIYQEQKIQFDALTLLEVGPKTGADESNYVSPQPGFEIFYAG